jgi:hypothetical protein
MSARTLRSHSRSRNVPLSELRSMSFDEMRNQMDVNRIETFHLPRLGPPRMRQIESGMILKASNN